MFMQPHVLLRNGPQKCFTHFLLLLFKKQKYLRIDVAFLNSNIEFKVKPQTKIFAVIKSPTAAFHKTFKLLRSIFSAVHAAKILHTGPLNSCVFP